MSVVRVLTLLLMTKVTIQQFVLLLPITSQSLAVSLKLTPLLKEMVELLVHIHSNAIFLLIILYYGLPMLLPSMVAQMMTERLVY
jgi:hypothetical protein